MHLLLIITFHGVKDISSTSFYEMQNRLSEFSVSLTEDFRHTYSKPTNNSFCLVISMEEYFINLLYCGKNLLSLEYRRHATFF